MDNKDQAVQKRPREPLFDTEENILTTSDSENGQKRRRLAVEGVENQNPQRQTGGTPSRPHPRWVGLEVKPDTPAIASVQSRLQQLTRGQQGAGAPLERFSSDPGEGSSGPVPLVVVEGCRTDICHIGENEFSSRVERFETTITPQSSPSRSTPSPWKGPSGFVHNIQQQLQTSETQSTTKALLIRKEREDELRRLIRQPVAENMWLKRNWSDPTLDRDDTSVQSDDIGDLPISTETAPSAGPEPCLTDKHAECDMNSHEEMSTSAMIDKMFEDVLQAADQEEEKEKDGVDEEKTRAGTDNVARAETNENIQTETDEGVVTEDEKDEVFDLCEEDHKEKADKVKDCSDKDEEETKEETHLSGNEDDLLTLPPSCVLSPLSNSVEAAVTPLRLTSTVPKPSVLILPPEDLSTPPPESIPPLYSIDAYRSQRKTAQPTFQSVTPGVQRRVPKTSCLTPAINTKERIKVLNEEAVKLERVISQTLQALSCCIDEEHGKGSLEEAEAEKLLLVSSEKRTALLAEVCRLREENTGKAGRAEAESDSPPMQPCRGTITISDVQLPLKVEFVCSAHAGRPTHYFFVLIRYGPCNIVATPLATAADAKNGDTISFPTLISLQDIRSNFEIDVEVYSLSHSLGNAPNSTPQQYRSSTRSKVTRKVLNSITKSSHSMTPTTQAALISRRSSNFTLVGSHKITLASLGQNKFPLDKVPFLSPLEGHIYLRLDSESHSNVQHQGFLTMFEDKNGFGAWHRLFFVLEGDRLLYWNHPNEMGNKPPEGTIPLSRFTSQCVKPVKRDSCARPFTFELVSTKTLEQEDKGPHVLTKCWFAADSSKERTEWMEKLNQVLLDLRTWTQQPGPADNHQPSTSFNSGTSRESIL
ncbi:anillin, actin binding protein 2 [Chanos chanos]|uniref:Anillin, actin binding protein 2 n=1 Tax=Chanos chanos TaxID=29144 RepID=A0A6J2WEP5_CHACN|nr:anillin-like [Chanos chanos]